MSGLWLREDPIVTLRHLITAQKKVRFQDDYLLSDSHMIHRSSRCGYRIANGMPRMDVGSIWYMFREISGDRPYTLETTRKRGFQYIGVANRGDLCDYLVGRADTCAGLCVARKRERDGSEQEGIDEAPSGGEPHVTDPKAKAMRRARQNPLKTAKVEDRKRAGELSYADVEERVRPVKDLDVLARVPGQIVPNADLILKIAQEEVSHWHQRAERRQEAEAGPTPMLSELERMLRHDKQNKPIILVPCNKNAPINLLTVQRLLQDGAYSQIDEEKVRFFESMRAESVDIVRNLQGRLWTFEARDSTKGFTKNHWLRVVAVISDGSDWQFKGWPFESIVDLFATVRGFYFCPRGELPAQHIQTWAVHVLKMPQMQFQHQFAQIRDVFWSEVEGFLRSQRQKKFSNNTTLDTNRTVTKTLPVL